MKYDIYDISTPFFRVFMTAFGQDADIICRNAETDKDRVAYAVNEIKKEKLDSLLKQALSFKDENKDNLNKSILTLDDEEIIEVGCLADNSMTLGDILNLIITEVENKISAPLNA